MLPFEIPRPAPLIRGTLIQRYKRFMADVKLDTGETVTAHCVNTGAMEGLTRPGTRVWLSRADNPARKLQFTWELAEVWGGILGVNTSLPNRVVGELLKERALSGLTRWQELRPEKVYGERSRVDFWMRIAGREHYLEVKNCHLVYPDARAYFPDCVSERAAGHLRELAAVLSKGASAEVLFFVQIPGVKAVRPSDVHDPAFAAAAREAATAGVKFTALEVRHTPDRIVVERKLPVDLKPYSTEPVAGWRTEWLGLRGTPLNP
ncbi:MAG: DNA/RNA nuclease SfsA [Candidatus Sumerlaeaceae bacterium]|nr:DNA/RNA nuclease SfsA [Candidatus Sumerlaeaceae bacterium]